MGKHFEKLIQCDPRLNFLSQQGDITVENPYFEPRISVFDDPNDNKAGFDLNNEGGTFFNLMEATSPSGGQSSSSRNEHDFISLSRDSIRHETPSPSSGKCFNQSTEDLSLHNRHCMPVCMISLVYGFLIPCFLGKMEELPRNFYEIISN